MEGLSTCHKCKKHIKSGEIRTYAGGWVWHKRCYPKTKPKKITRKRRAIR